MDSFFNPLFNTDYGLAHLLAYISLVYLPYHRVHGLDSRKLFVLTASLYVLPACPKSPIEYSPPTRLRYGDSDITRVERDQDKVSPLIFFSTKNHNCIICTCLFDASFTIPFMSTLSYGVMSSIINPSIYSHAPPRRTNIAFARSYKSNLQGLDAKLALLPLLIIRLC
jgi:hypothetical protein